MFGTIFNTSDIRKTFLVARKDNYSNKILLFHRKTVGDSRSFFDHFFISWQPQICKLARHSSSLYFIFYSQVFFLLAANLTAALPPHSKDFCSFMSKFSQVLVYKLTLLYFAHESPIACFFSLFFFFFVAPVACN